MATTTRTQDAVALRVTASRPGTGERVEFSACRLSADRAVSVATVLEPMMHGSTPVRLTVADARARSTGLRPDPAIEEDVRAYSLDPVSDVCLLTLNIPAPELPWLIAERPRGNDSVAICRTRPANADRAADSPTSIR